MVLTELQSLKYLKYVGMIILLRHTEFLWAYVCDMIMLKLKTRTSKLSLGIFIVILTTSLIAYNAAYDVKYMKTMKRIQKKFKKLLILLLRVLLSGHSRIFFILLIYSTCTKVLFNLAVSEILNASK